MELPAITRGLIWLGNFLNDYGWFVIPLFCLFLLILVYILFGNKKTRFIGQYILFRFPIVGRLIQEAELARFGFIMGNLLNAGLPILEALASLRQATTTVEYQKLYERIRQDIENGDSFAQSFHHYPHIALYIPPPIQEMIISGEKSGNLSEIFVKIGNILEEKTENTTKNLTALLEPMLLLIVWGGVVLVALSVILPIYSLIGGLSGSGTSTPPPPAPPAVTEEIQNENPQLPEEISPQETKNIDLVEILPTGIGYLNVRQNGVIIDTVTPGETYPLLNLQDGWYEIELPNGITGWVSGRYVRLLPAGQ